MATIKKWNEEINKLNYRECNELIDAFDRLMAWSAMHEYVNDFTTLRTIIESRRPTAARQQMK